MAQKCSSRHHETHSRLQRQSETSSMLYVKQLLEQRKLWRQKCGVSEVKLLKLSRKYQRKQRPVSQSPPPLSEQVPASQGTVSRWSSSTLGNNLSTHLNIGELALHTLVLFCFSRQSLSVAVQEHSLLTRLALNSQRSASLCLLSAGIKGVYHRT